MEEGTQCEEVLDHVAPYVAAESLESDDGGGGLRGLRQSREDLVDIHVEEDAGDLVDRGGGQQTGRVGEAVLHLVVVEEADVASGVAGRGPVERVDQTFVGGRFAAVPDKAPQRPVGVEEIAGRR